MIAKIKALKIQKCVCQNIQNFVSKRDNIFTISILGRPNVGKSTLFNKLIGEHSALTDPTPGLTRDRKEKISKLFQYPIRLVDTAGWEFDDKQQTSELVKKMMDQTMQSLIYSNLALFVIDAKNGINNIDIHLSKWLRQKTLNLNCNEIITKSDEIFVQKTILVANKCENDDMDIDYEEIYKLGFGHPLMISAEHGDNMQDLIQAIQDSLPKYYEQNFEDRVTRRIEKHLYFRNLLKQEIQDLQKQNKINQDFNLNEWESEFDYHNRNPEENSDLDSDKDYNPIDTLTQNIYQNESGISTQNYYKNKPIQISIVGRPNVGKSTLTNSLLQENRVVVDDLPGTTRDAISNEWVYKGKKIILVDTAGITKSLKLTRDIEKKIHIDTLKAVKYSHVVVCVIDSLNSFRVQDLAVARYIVQQGRSLILVINKWDLVAPEWKGKAKKYMQKQIDKALGEVKGVPIITCSALQGYNTEEIMQQVIKIYDKWNARISTGLLNDWLNKFKKLSNLPQNDGDQLKIRFITQIKSRPPTFTMFVNTKTLFKDNYMRFVKSNLTEEFQLQGVPIRVVLRDSKYQKKKKTFQKESPLKQIRKLYLRNRRIAGFAKKKMEKMMKIK